MSEDVFESLVEQHIAQLEKISERRNVLLREMYQILRRRNNIGAVLTIDDEDEDDFHVFLNKYDLQNNPETGYIGHLPDNELFNLVPAQPAPSSPPPQPPSSSDKPRSRRSKSVTSDLGESSVQPSHLPKIPEASALPTPRPLVDHGDSDDELDLIGSPAVHHTPPIVPKYIDTTPEPAQVLSVDPEPEELVPPNAMATEMDSNEEVKDEEVEEVSREVVEGHVNEEDGREEVKEAIKEEEKNKPDPKEDEIEEVYQTVENYEKEGETALIKEAPSVLASPSILSPVPTPDEISQAVSAEVKETGEDVMMEDLQIDTLLPKEVDVAPFTLPTAEAPVQDEHISDAEPMILDSSPLQPAQQLSEAPVDQTSPSALSIADIPEVLETVPTVLSQPATLTPETVVEMDVDSGLVQQEPEETELSVAEASGVPVEEPVQSEVTQPVVEPKSPEAIPPREHAPQHVVSSLPPLSEECGTPEPLVLPDPPSPVFISAPSLSYSGFGEFNFPADPSSEHPPAPPESLAHTRHPLYADYPLPPLDSLPIEFNRKKRLKQQKKKEKEREKGDVKKDRDGGKDDWAPWGANRWIATIRTNPVHKKVSKATKCLSTREWNVAMQELKFLRTMDKIEMLKSTGCWSFRQPKKQRGVGGLSKSHWDYLMDEMKWMRTDFREERKWKMVLAYNLSTAVLEWHAAGSLEKRLKRGICVLWKPPRQDNGGESSGSVSQPALDPMELETPELDNPSLEKSLLMLDYGSDDDDEDDQDKDQQSIADAQDTAALVEDSLGAAEDKNEDNIGLKDLEPKTEVVDDSTSLAMDVDIAPSIQESQEIKDGDMVSLSEHNVEADFISVGLKSTSNNPMLDGVRKTNSQSSEPSAIPPSKTSKKNLYAPLRERIAHSDLHKLFLDLDDFHITTPNPDSTGDDDTEYTLPPSDLSDIFPDLQPYTLLDVAPSLPLPVEEKKPKDKKSDRDDPNKRIEEVAYTKIYPASKFIHLKPTLVSSLQPATHFKNRQWMNLDETPISVEHDGTPVRITEDFSNGLFDHKVAPQQIFTSAAQNQFSWVPKDKDGKPREPPRRVEHHWNSNDDVLLKSLVDKYLNNWELIAESFNAVNQTVKTDKRTSRDCQERWKERWSQDRRGLPEASSAVDEYSSQSIPPPTPVQMTTRGVKRGASLSVSSSSVAGEMSTKKRRRHTLMQDFVRKAAKKRVEALQKLNNKKPAITHESHASYNKMPKMTPADLSRLKADREYNDQQQVHLARLKAQQQAAQAQQQAQQAQQQNQQSQQSQPPPSQQQQQSQQNGAQARSTPTTQVNGQAQPAGAAPPNGVPRTSTSGLQTQGTVPQIRSQVAQVPISGQQRSNTPLTRLSPQQLLQVRVQQQALSQVLAAQMQAHQVASSSGGTQPAQQNGQVAVNGSSMSPPYTATNSRDATSSPAATHGSPPRTSATPSNAMNSPRPLSAQAGQVQGGQIAQGQHQQQQPQQMAQVAGILQNVQQNGQIGVGVNIPRATNIQGYYLPNVMTNEQLQNIMRLQLAQQQQQHQQHQHQQ